MVILRYAAGSLVLALSGYVFYESRDGGIEAIPDTFVGFFLFLLGLGLLVG